MVFELSSLQRYPIPTSETTGGPGTMEILGGTGVYTGISGSCTYDVGYMPDNWFAMIADCTWQR